MRRTRHYALVAILTIALAAIPAVTAAHETETKTKAFLDDGGPKGASGHLTSMRDACLRHRRVSLFREQDGPDQKYGWDMTSRAGMFNVDADLLAGMYYVKVKALDLDASDDHDHWCLSARSIKVQF